MVRKIERMEVFGVDMPLVGEFTSAGVTKQVTKCVVVRLTASDGTVGISSIEPSAAAKSPHTARELEATLRERIAPAVIGQDPLNVHRLSELFDTLSPTQPGAAAGAEMACVELAARMCNVSLCEYLGGALQESVEFNGWIGMLPPDEAAAEAKGGGGDMTAKRAGWAGIALGFLAFTLFASNPFARLDPAPADGAELNPILQDPGLAWSAIDAGGHGRDPSPEAGDLVGAERRLGDRSRVRMTQEAIGLRQTSRARRELDAPEYRGPGIFA